MNWEQRLAQLIGRPGDEAGKADEAGRLAQQRWARVEEVFEAALTAGDGADAVIARECQGDSALADEVRSLLAAHRESGAADQLARDLGDIRQNREPAAGDRVGRYIIERELGRGGMGLVYAARDERLGRTVALKLLSRFLSADPDSTRRFLQEARSAAALEHPSICAIHEVGETGDGQLFIAMPFYKGETLAARIARGPLPVPDALAVALDVARGLGHAHANGIIHRDIKPANLFLVENGGVKILDFGIAKVADGTITTGGAVLGTITYMSPEQATGEKVDHRTDLWSLGVVLHEMLTGRCPFSGPSPQSMIAAILTTDPPPITGVPGVGAVHGVLRRLLAKDLPDRAPDAAMVVAALEEARAGAEHGPVWEGAEDAPPIAAEGERRQVTVLAVQVDHYSSLVERFTPDELEQALRRFRETAVRIAARHGGVLHQFTGESLVALFGVPVTHEDDTVRSVSAARELLAWGAEGWRGEDEDMPGLALRGGVSAGMIVVQPDRATRSFRLAGDALDAATRLAGQARGGEVKVGPECERALAAHAAAEPARVPATPFAGRSRELAQVSEALGFAVAGEGQFVTIEGEAGAGKSRLIQELGHTTPVEAFQVVRVSCRAHGVDARPYWPFATAARELLGLDTTAAPADLARQLTERVPELAESVPLFLQLFGVASDQPATHRFLEGGQFGLAMRDALVTLFTLATRARPVLLVFEDWHWADDASHGVLAQLAGLAPAWRLALVITYRQAPSMEWLGSVPRREVRLGPLGADSTKFLISSLLGAETASDAAVAAIHQRAAGNPFFIEEICHAVREQGGVQVRGGHAELTAPLEAQQLPGTIQGVIRSRLDRLDPASREVARAASVAGREFSIGMVHALVPAETGIPAAIEQLTRAGIIHQTRVAPEPAYRFKHILTQEVAYDTLLAHQRRALHAQLGTAMETLNAGQLNELAGTLSYHFSRAESWREAVRYGREEARQAVALSEFPRALRVIDQVEAWARKLKPATERRETLTTVLLEEERICESLGLRKRQQEILGRLIELLDPERDQGMLAVAHLRLADLLTLLRDFDRAQAAVDQALALARASGNVEAERGALTTLGMLFWHRERGTEGLGYLEQALGIDRALHADDKIARDLFNLSTIHKTLGNLDEAREALDAALASAEAAGDPWFGVVVLYNAAGIHRLQGEDSQALARLQEALELSRAHGAPMSEGMCLAAIAALQLNRGEPEAAIEHYKEAARVGRRIHDATGLSRVLTPLANALLGQGRDQEALPVLYEAAELFGDMEDRTEAERNWTRIGVIEEERRAWRAAAAAWGRVREFRRLANDQDGELDALLHMARALRDTSDDIEMARTAFADGLRLAMELEDRKSEGELRNAAGILEWRAGRYESALEHYEQALAIHRGLGDRAREGLALNSIGATQLCLHRIADARRTLEQAAALNHATGQDLLEGHALASLGDALLAAGEAAEAARRYEASLEIRRRIGDRRGEGWMLHHLARAARAVGEEQKADGLDREAREIAAAIPDAELERAATPDSGRHAE